MIGSVVIGSVAFAASVAVLVQQPQPPVSELRPPPVVFTISSPLVKDAPLPAPDDNRPTPAAFRLGERLFHETALSDQRRLACATCHIAGFGFAEPRPRALDHGQLRNTPTLYNRAFGQRFGWDGRADTLEAQVLLPIENPLEMALPVVSAVDRLRGDGSYVAEFYDAFGEAPTEQTLARALATYVRSLTIGDSPVDRFTAARDRTALSVAERAGLWLYESKARCWRCHTRPNFSDEKFHNTGVGAVGGVPTDLGRYQITKVEADRGAFKTPTLRGLAFTAPYLHDGSLATLEEVVEFYRRGGNRNDYLDPLLEPLDLTDDDVSHLVAFLRALSRPAEASR